MIISGPSDDYSNAYRAINQMIPHFTEQKESGEGKDVVIEVPGDFTLDEKHKQVFLTDDGHQKAEELLTKAGALNDGSSLYDAKNLQLLQLINSALKAHLLFRKMITILFKEMK